MRRSCVIRHRQRGMENHTDLLHFSCLEGQGEGTSTSSQPQHKIEVNAIPFITSPFPRPIRLCGRSPSTRMLVSFIQCHRRKRKALLSEHCYLLFECVSDMHPAACKSARRGIAEKHCLYASSLHKYNRKRETYSSNTAIKEEMKGSRSAQLQAHRKSSEQFMHVQWFAAQYWLTTP